MNDLKRHILNGIESSDIYELAICSPIERADGLSARLANEIYFKREDLQPVFSFKLRESRNLAVATFPISPLLVRNL